MAPSGKLPFYVTAGDYAGKFEARNLITDPQNFNFMFMPHITCAAVTIGICGEDRYWRLDVELSFYVIVNDYPDIILPPLRL